MKIEDLNEGPIGGLVGAARAQSKDPKVAARGRAQLAKAGARKAGSKRGQKAKKKKMAAAMLAQWQQTSNQIRVDTSAEPTADDLNDWVKNFMGDDKDIGKAYSGSMRDRPVRNYFSKLVDTFYIQNPKDRAAADKKAADQKAQGATQAGLDQKTRNAQIQALGAREKAANQPAAPTANNADAIAALKKMGANDEEVQLMMKKAIANGADPNNASDIVAKAINKESIERNLMMKYLTEATRSARMEHIEDLVFNDGFDGAKAALTYIEQVVSMLANGSGKAAKITVKWDGSPAIVCGIDPEDGKFFVGTKSVFAKGEPKVIKSKRHIDKWYGDQPDLAKKLGLALKFLPKLGIGNVLQGDFMFDSGDIETTTIEGEKMIEFTPNTITYAVPSKSDLAATMKRAKFGIVFHTSYEGNTIAEMTPVYGVDVAGLNRTPDVWFDDATYKDLTGTASLTPKELSKISNTVKAIESTMSKIRPAKFDIVIQNKEFGRFVKPFINQMVRDGKLVTNPIAFLKEFLEFYKGKMQIEMDKISAEKGEDASGVKNRLAKIKAKEEFIEDNSNALLGVLAVYKRLVEIKLLIINKLHQVEGLQTFIKDGDGYKVTNPEGFVAIGHHGDAVKLVDRLEFSKQNFNMVHGWQKK